MATAPQTPFRPTEYPTEGAESARAADQGWLVFAGITLIAAAVMRFFDALWAFNYHGSIPYSLENALFGHSLDTYGWVWIGVAVVLGLSGVGVMLRSQVGRWVGVVAGVIGAVTAIWWMPYYPVWSLVYIALGIFVIYALVAHGSNRAEAY